MVYEVLHDLALPTLPASSSIKLLIAFCALIYLHVVRPLKHPVPLTTGTLHMLFPQPTPPLFHLADDLIDLITACGVPIFALAARKR